MDQQTVKGGHVIAVRRETASNVLGTDHIDVAQEGVNECGTESSLYSLFWSKAAKHSW